ncbi:hypothetical protein SEA_SAMISTI12_129 [Streptomyces phage Samisti12]|uniref:Uncharacterized protein n=4 Tax=Samistivirus TaxID=2560220 RepID=A0A223G017_9CAUD|nr:hypothetical protein FDI38_gp147 [Streptomyces phage Peebs]YP_009611557.1 hypothetical protein FDI39_gp145 [Streptomyces phage Samisti12]ASR76547.1 hypothetical protein SEA_SUSHI23_127 [Streptomyces phage Sushi23]QGH78307.1 hypothetical protein SEA_TRIBUTE_127 [Streptomyces phage Tribute]WDS51913.1 hypothetical protein SEA_PEPPERWOOD_127 [Streptomyces phage Pepperwood]ASR77821.1 hypothetical protein SEA_PEEBS_126 [Streptomyces phage Peebs]AST15349.1 hypothetical protein SEA_SAMISTI12_129 [
MSYDTRRYTFNGSNALADEVAYLAVKNHCRVSNRVTTGIFKKEHIFVVFGPNSNLDRFESEMKTAKRNIK